MSTTHSQLLTKEKRSISSSPTKINQLTCICNSCSVHPSVMEKYFKLLATINPCCLKNLTPAIIPFYPSPASYIYPTLLNHSYGYIYMTLRNLSLYSHFPPGTILFLCSPSQQTPFHFLTLNS